MNKIGEYKYEIHDLDSHTVARSGPLTMVTTGKRMPRFVIKRYGKTIRKISGDYEHAKRVWRKVRRRVG